MLTRELKRLGADWDRRHGSFRIPLSRLPKEIKVAILISENLFKKMAQRFDRKLASLNPEKIAEKLSISDLFDTAIFKVDKDISKNLEKIGIEIKHTEKERKKVVKEYVKDTEKNIIDFLEKETIKLRKTVIERAKSGQRSEGLVQEIMKSHDVSISKARFLARQETKLAVAKLKETRYISAGCPEYKWRISAGSKDHPVRHAHRLLDGKIFRWDKPPITSEPNQPIRRNNPQQDFNCRCTAVPIVKF